MPDNKQINLEQLETVTGGKDDWGEYKSRYLPEGHGVHICKEDVKNHIEEKVYVVFDSNEEMWVLGIVKQSSPVGGDIYHYVYVEEKSSKSLSTLKSIECFEGSNYTVFLYK